MRGANYWSIEFEYKNSCLTTEYELSATYEDAMKTAAKFLVEYLDRPFTQKNIKRIWIGLWESNEEWITDRQLKKCIIYEDDPNGFFSDNKLF